MKKIMMLLVAGTMLSGCATSGGVDQAAIAAFIARVQVEADRICGFVPTAGTVTGLSGVLGDVLGIAQLICSLVPPPPAAALRTARRVTGSIVTVGQVRGVTVRGRYTR